MAKCWIYNELADIPDEFIVVERKEESMFDDLKRVLTRKKWIRDAQSTTNSSSTVKSMPDNTPTSKTTGDK